MAQINLNLGTQANDSTGDSLRAAMQSIQTNTSELYAKGVTPLFATIADLPTASDHHGMFAHVHSTGAAYFAHAGSWIKLQMHTAPTTVVKNGSNVFTVNLADNINFILEADAVWAMTVTAAADQVGQAGNIIIKNTATTSPASLPSNLKTPNGDTIAWQTDSGDVAIISYFVVDTSTILVNYVGNFS
tara:strand:+ start:2219 stop:2782 length:564 start_codon:yes stop_codon:yes gene_type:complete